jgi:hypothetical protein
MLSVVILSATILSALMLSALMLSVVILSATILSAVASKIYICGISHNRSIPIMNKKIYKII